MALGASRGRMTRQMIVEGLLIALAGGLLGLVVAPAVSRVLLLFLPEGANLTTMVDLRIFLFALAVSVVAGTVCSLAPALQAARRPLTSSINGRSTVAGTAVRFRKLIVGAQLALTLVLLVGAGLFVQTLARLHAKDFGFDSGRLLMFRVDPAGIGYSASDAPRLMRDLLRRLQDVPVVERAAVANTSVLTGGGLSRTLTIQADDRVVTDRPMSRDARQSGVLLDARRAGDRRPRLRRARYA